MNNIECKNAKKHFLNKNVKELDASQAIVY